MKGMSESFVTSQMFYILIHEVFTQVNININNVCKIDVILQSIHVLCCMSVALQ